GASGFNDFAQQAPHMQSVDIINNSWGWDGYFYDNFNTELFSSSRQAIEDVATLGRGGLGSFITFAAGNSGDVGDNVNYHSFQNSQYVTAVGGVNSDGSLANFSTPGAAVLVSAGATNILTTDRLGSLGYTNGDTVSISGTSFSAPTVAGVAALILEANPTLGYRDIQE
ncbi:MAG: S8 family serine peptidase, partial [Rhodospirillales bacterium]